MSTNENFQIVILEGNSHVPEYSVIFKNVVQNKHRESFTKFSA